MEESVILGVEKRGEDIADEPEKSIPALFFEFSSKRFALCAKRGVDLFLQSRHMLETDCLQKIIESSFSNKSLFIYMLYDTTIKETRCMKNLMTAHKNGFEVTRSMKESVREMLDRLYIVAYLFKMKFRHPVAKASC